VAVVLDVADRVAPGEGVAVLGQRVQGQAEVAERTGVRVGLQEPLAGAFRDGMDKTLSKSYPP